MQKYDKLKIADKMLEKSIDSYLDEKDYFSALHLAGAAQEIYGKWLRINGGQNFSTVMLDHIGNITKEPIDRKKIIKEEKRPKNSIKHLDNKNDRFAYLNPQIDSFSIISDAIMDHMLLKRNETNNISRFKEHIRKALEND